MTGARRSLGTIFGAGHSEIPHVTISRMSVYGERGVCHQFKHTFLPSLSHCGSLGGEN